MLGVVPKDTEVFMLDGTHWLPDTPFMCIPKGVTAEKLAVLIQLRAFMQLPEQQAGTCDRDYCYPGPVTDVPLSAAPTESQAVMRDYGRPQCDRWVADRPVETPLTPDRLVLALRRWDEQVGLKRAK